MPSWVRPQAHIQASIFIAQWQRVNACARPASGDAFNLTSVVSSENLPKL